MPGKIRDYAAFAEVISAIAVVITLIVLIIEVREGNELTRATAAAASRDALASHNDLMLAFDDDMMTLMSDMADPEFSWDDFQVPDKVRMMLLERSFFRRAEAQFFRYQAKLLDEEAWITVRNRVVINLKFPGWKEVWDRESRSVYTPAFIEEIESQFALHGIDR